MAAVADLDRLCRAALRVAQGDEEVEAFAVETRRTEVRVRASAVESLTVAATRGVGVRVIVGGRLGYAWAADPSEEEVAETGRRARENAALATADEHNALASAEEAEPLPGLFRADQAALFTDRKVALALDLEAASVRSHPRVRKLQHAAYGDAVSRVAIASTTGLSGEYARTDCWCAVSALAEDAGETQTGFAYRLGREAGELDWQACAAEASGRAARLLGATKPSSAHVPVVLDPAVAVAFLGVLAGALSADAVQKGRSLLAGRTGEPVAARELDLVDDGRFLLGPGASPFDDEGVPTQRTPLIERGRLAGYLHNTYTARRGSTLSTGNAARGGYRTAPGVSATNLYLEAGTADPESLLRSAEGGVYIQEVAGVHSGANPISGEFSVGATGLRIAGGALGEPLREMTVASTLLEMLSGVAAIGSDLRFFGSIGAPTLLVADMSVAGR